MRARGKKNMAKQARGAKNFRLADFFQALEKAQAALPPLVLALGECEYLRGRAVAALTEAWSAAHGGEVHRPQTLAEVNAELGGTGLFAADKLVVVRRGQEVFGFGGEKKKKEPSAADDARQKAFIEKLESPAKNIWLLMESATAPGNRTLGKKLAACCTIVPCDLPNEADITQWLGTAAAAKGKTLAREVADMLIKSQGTDMARLECEVEKLALYAGDKKHIDLDMAADFFTGDIQFDTFKMSNAVTARNLQEALYYARRIGLQGLPDGKPGDTEGSAEKILAGLCSTMAGLLRAGVANVYKKTPDEFAAAEGMHPFRAKRLMEDARKYTLPELRKMAALTADTMRGAHDTERDVFLSLELLAVGLTRREHAN